MKQLALYGMELEQRELRILPGSGRVRGVLQKGTAHPGLSERERTICV